MGNDFQSAIRCGNKHRSMAAAHMCSINPACAGGSMHCCAATKFIDSTILYGKLIIALQ
jgi:hypothetical protein